MKKLLLFCFAACLSFVVSAQKVYFLYLQTDDLSPFYVRMGDKIHSSSTTGYLIVPNLVDSTYLLGLGFPKSTQPETRFAVTISQNDKGYLVKSFTEGLSLFDMQELSIVKSVSASNQNTVYETKTDKFSSVLSKAANDPSLLKVAVTKKEEQKSVVEEKKEALTVKKEEVVPAADLKEKDSVKASPVETVQNNPEPKKEPITNEPAASSSNGSELTKEPKGQPEVKEEPVTDNLPITVYKPSSIVRRSESSTTEGFGIVFFDKAENYTDTIRILIPPSKFKIDADAPAANLSEIEKKRDNPVSSADPSQTEVKVDQPAIESKPKEPFEVKSSPKVNLTNNSTTCKQSASEKDFVKLRRNMASEETDEAMIDEAKKVFKSKCFTVEQIRYLSTLFLTSAAKYQFFDASFNHVSDKQNFASLQSEIKDEYYLKRFKALAGE